mgnify:CR=1 FL=1
MCTRFTKHESRTVHMPQIHVPTTPYIQNKCRCFYCNTFLFNTFKDFLEHYMLPTYMKPFDCRKSRQNARFIMETTTLTFLLAYNIYIYVDVFAPFSKCHHVWPNFLSPNMPCLCQRCTTFGVQMPTAMTMLIVPMYLVLCNMY